MTAAFPSAVADLRLVASHVAVYEPCDDSFALADALSADLALLQALRPLLCVEVGSGSGYVAASLALLLRPLPVQIFATDISVPAAITTQATLRSHGVNGEVVVTSLVEGMQRRLHHSVDVMLFNPPYVPTPPEEVGKEGITAAWAGGERGREVVDRMLPRVKDLLAEKGVFYLVALAENDIGDISRVMLGEGFRAATVLVRRTEEETLHVLRFRRI